MLMLKSSLKFFHETVPVKSYNLKKSAGLHYCDDTTKYDF